jgi:hypothetical protein
MSQLVLTVNLIKGLRSRLLTSSNLCGIARAASSSQQTQKVSYRNEDWSSIYKFHHIQTFASLNNLKIYQVALTALAVPFSLAFPDLSTVVVAYVGVSGAITLSLASYAMRNVVGFIYTSQKQPENVKISYLSFWGQRKDIVVSIADVKPLSEVPKSRLGNHIASIQFYNDDLKLKMFHRQGEVHDFDEFTRVFGEY